MPDSIIINVSPYEGEYEWDFSSATFSYVEWRWIKSISGYLPLTIQKGYEGGDPDLILAMAVIALYRAGKIEAKDAIDVAGVIETTPVDGATITLKKEEADVSPLTSEPDEKSSSSEGLKLDSGNSTKTDSEPSLESADRSGSGIPDSATGSDSDRLTLAK